MTTEEVVSHFPGARPNGRGGYSARCPAHDDRNPSLEIKEAADGRTLIRCFAGCKTPDVVAAAGLRISDLFPDSPARATVSPSKVNGQRLAHHDPAPAPQPTTEPKGQPEAVYAYRSVEGVGLAEKLRYPGKVFRWRRPDGQGNWIADVKDINLPLYRLLDIRERGASDLYVVEGEKDADRLWSVDLPATTAPHGSSRWAPEYTAQIKTAVVERVYLVPDNDAPGRQYAQLAAASCHAAGLDVKLVTLPDLPEHGDVSNYLDTHTAADLTLAALQAPEWHPPSRAKLTWLNTVTPKEVSWLWPGRLAKGKGTMLGGNPGTGKSWLSEDIIARVTRGLPWPDGGTAPMGKAIILSSEDGIDDTIRPRIDALGGDPSAVAVLEMVKDDDDDVERAFSLDRDIPVLTAELRRHHFSIVVIDPITAYLGMVNSHKDADIRRVLTPLFQTIEEYGASLLMIAHLNKNSTMDALYRISGSVALVAAARIGMVLGRDPDDQDRRILAPIKCNLSAFPPALAYRIDLQQGGLIWESAPVDLDAAAVLAPRMAGEGNADATEWLRSFLEDGEVDSKAVFEAGGREGFSRGVLNAAKKKLGIRPRKIGFSANAHWAWSLPAARQDIG